MGKEECTSKSPTRQMRAKPAAVDCDLPVAESRYHQCHRAADDLLTDYFWLIVWKTLVSLLSADVTETQSLFFFGTSIIDDTAAQCL